MRADVVVIGAGYTGISTALALAQGGAKVAVLERGELGAGGSGLNGGQVIPGLKHDPDSLVRELGEARGTEVVRFVLGCADVLFDLVRAHNIDCEPVRTGWIQPTVSAVSMSMLKERALQFNHWGGEADVLDRNAVQQLLGSRPDVYCGGWINRRGGNVHPLNYLYGLVRAAQGAGATVHPGSNAIRISRARGSWDVTLQHGPTVTADRVVIATNAYTDDLWPGVRHTIVGANSLQLATAPLPPELLSSVLPQRQAVSDSRRVMNYYRIGPQGRLLFGGRGPFRLANGVQDYSNLTRAMHHFYPQLRDVPVEFCWNGKVALTRDSLPHVHQPQPGITILLGCNGRGVALSSALGIALGRHLLGAGPDLPFNARPIQPLPLHGLHKLYASLLIQYYRLADRVG